MPLFAKRHYEAIAMALQAACPTSSGIDLAAWANVRNELSAMFTRDNPKFNDVRFYEACKPGANVSAR